jgi:hypothetical protein
VAAEVATMTTDAQLEDVTFDALLRMAPRHVLCPCCGKSPRLESFESQKKRHSNYSTLFTCTMSFACVCGTCFTIEASQERAL